jgi:hypothetical protein
MAIPAFSSLPKQQQLAILIGVPLLVAVILGYTTRQTLGKLGPDPALHRLLQRPTGKWVEINAKEAEIAEKDKIIALLPEVKKEFDDLQDEIKRNEERLPLEAEKTEMRQQIEKMAREVPSDIGIVSFKAVKIVEGPLPTGGGGRGGTDYQTITYQTEVEGDYNGIIKYIDTIEKNIRFLTVQSLVIKPGKVELNDEKTKIVSPILHQVSMDVVTYVYNTPTRGR